MKTAAHTEARFTNEEAAREHLESTRWPTGPVCPHCGGTERNSRLEGKAHRPGLLFCGDCRTQFSVTVGTVFEDSKLPLHKWVYAIHLLCSSKKGMSSKQLERMLGVTYKTAWFMSHRIRAAMATTPTDKLGGKGKIVEVDETYYGKKKGTRLSRVPASISTAYFRWSSVTVMCARSMLPAYLRATSSPSCASRSTSART